MRTPADDRWINFICAAMLRATLEGVWNIEDNEF